MMRMQAMQDIVTALTNACLSARPGNVGVHCSKKNLALKLRISKAKIFLGRKVKANSKVGPNIWASWAFWPNVSLEKLWHGKNALEVTSHECQTFLLIFSASDRKSSSKFYTFYGSYVESSDVKSRTFWHQICWKRNKAPAFVRLARSGIVNKRAAARFWYLFPSTFHEIQCEMPCPIKMSKVLNATPSKIKILHFMDFCITIDWRQRCEYFNPVITVSWLN